MLIKCNVIMHIAVELFIQKLCYATLAIMLSCAGIICMLQRFRECSLVSQILIQNSCGSKWIT